MMAAATLISQKTDRTENGGLRCSAATLSSRKVIIRRVARRVAGLRAKVGPKRVGLNEGCPDVCIRAAMFLRERGQ